MLREARLSAGIDIASLARLTKVPAAKIEALEGDRFEVLPGVAFTRGLALAVARSLKIDADPILARLPKSAGDSLDDVSRGLNAPFRAGTGLLAELDLNLLKKPIIWGPVAFLAAGVAVWLMPIAPFGRDASELLQGLPAISAPAAPGTPITAPGTSTGTSTGTTVGPTGAPERPPLPAANGGDATVRAPGFAVDQPSVEIVHAVPPAIPGAVGIDVGDGNRPLQLRAGAASWVEVRDARGSLLLSRTLQPGETISLAGALPLRAVVGNAADTTAIVHGRDFNIAAFTQGNVARFEVR